MFDKTTLVVGHVRHDSYARVDVDVHEHRAPTDASVKLMREMEQAALDKVLGTIRLEDCPVDCVIVHMRDFMEDQHRFLLRYKIGTKQREVRHNFRRPVVSQTDNQIREACLDQLMAVLAEDIAHVVLMEPFLKIASGKFPQFPA